MPYRKHRGRNRNRTPAQRAALRKAQLASAQKRRRRAKKVAKGAAIGAMAYGVYSYKARGTKTKVFAQRTDYTKGKRFQKHNESFLVMEHKKKDYGDSFGFGIGRRVGYSARVGNRRVGIAQTDNPSKRLNRKFSASRSAAKGAVRVLQAPLVYQARKQGMKVRY